MRLIPARAALAVVLGAAVLSCTDSLTAVRQLRPGVLSATAVPVPALVISQVYGGGGNANSVWKNDFIELFNPTGQPQPTGGLSVQYASSTGSSWQVTVLPAATIPAGAYYLVQEAAGGGGTTPLPTPDATGSIAMALGAGKVALVQGTGALSGTCPAALDFVSFGTAATNCGRKTTSTLDNTKSAIRLDGGCAYSDDLSADFTTSAPPAPRNSTSAPHPCAGTAPLGPFDHVAITGASSVDSGATTQLVAAAKDASDQTIPDATVVWSSSDESVATVDQTGLVTGRKVSPDSVTITATVTAGDVKKNGAKKLVVTALAIKFIDVSTSSSSLPPGFQTQLFVTARASQGGTIIPNATWKFESLDPDVATVRLVPHTSSAIITGVGTPNGTQRPRIRIIAALDNGTKPDTFTTSSTFTSIPTVEEPKPAPTSIYATNDEFGDPTPASTSNPNDLLIVRPQYTLSYNESRGTPNWVAYELDARQIVAGQDRCNCFTADPTLPADKQIFTSDYTNGGFDRGHMARSFDRTAGNTDNAATFYLTNIVPQMADLNQGVWAQLENDLGDSARVGGRAVYIITGPLYSRSHGLTFLKNEGKVAVPDSTWKIALIGPRSSGNPFTHGNVQNWDDIADLTILAVNMPNVSGVRNDPWSKYRTSVTKIEEATGYHFLSLLNAAFRSAVEVKDRAPSARYVVNGALAEGTSLTFDASASSDPDVGRGDLGRDEALTYEWQFSDGTKATGRTASHTFARFGSYTATLTVTDAFGWPNTVTQTLKIDDVAPTVSILKDADLIAGETYSGAGSFSDPGADSWSATANYGDGSGAQPLPLVDKSFALAYTYGNAGTFTLTVSVSDDGGAMGSSSATIRVITPLAATQGLAQQVQLLAEAGAIVGQQVQPLLASLDAASKQMTRGYNAPAVNELGAFANKLNAAVLSGRMSPDAAQQLTATATRIERVLGR